MTGLAQIINLRTAKKHRARAEKEAQATQNRTLFGRSKSEKLQEALAKDRAEKHIEGHKRED